jgi:hypothetical protein
MKWHNKEGFRLGLIDMCSNYILEFTNNFFSNDVPLHKESRRARTTAGQRLRNLASQTRYSRLYLPKCSSLSGSSPIQGVASSESKLLNGEDGAWPRIAESV